MTNNLAPITLFVYNRLTHTEKTIAALRKNTLATQSELFIFSDGPKDRNDEIKVNTVRSYIKQVSGFKHVSIIEREKNLGLADSITSGVTKVVNDFGKVIVLEDDIITSPHFLQFMNDSLNLYVNDKSVMEVSGYLWPEKKELPETFFMIAAPCWGWATWARAWKDFNPDIQYLMSEINSKNLVRKFNVDGGHNFFNHLRANADGNMKTWAIYWYASVFLRGGLCLYPRKSLTHNIGNDGSGTHDDPTKVFDTKLSLDKINVERIPLMESACARKLHRRFLKTTESPLRDRIRYGTRYYLKRVFEELKKGPSKNWKRIIVEKLKTTLLVSNLIIPTKRWAVRNVGIVKTRWFYFKNNFLKTRRGELLISNTENDMDGYIEQASERGMFSIFRQMLDIISVYGERKISVEFYNTLYNDIPEENMWEYYFEPLKNDVRRRYPDLYFNVRPYKDALSSENKTHLELFNQVIKDRVRIKQEILGKAEAYLQEHFTNKKIIGVHFRGTDVWKSVGGMTNNIFRKAYPEEYFPVIDGLLENGYDNIFLATDEEAVYLQFKERYGLKLLSYSKHRSTDKRVIVHYLTEKQSATKYAFTKKELGEEVIIDCVLLSKSDFFLYGDSNVSTVVKFFNAYMQSKNMDLIPTEK
ncbi:MAG: glycosyltransferase [bacterium]|nr:glycosyltransferase [bacterium]